MRIAAVIFGGCVVLAAAGCGDDGGGTGSPDAGVAHDAGAVTDGGTALDGRATLDAGTRADAGRMAPDAGGSCTRPAITTPTWLTARLQEVEGRITGQTELTPGVRIRERQSVASRDAVREYLRGELAAEGLTVEVRDYGTGANVVALLPATVTPGTSRVVLGAHFDGVSAGPAAADNGTGTALVIAAARFVQEQIPCRTRDVEFVLFDQEEDGLIGSGAYATALTRDPVPTVAAHSFDMISWDVDGDRLIELWLPSAEILADWEAAAEAHGARVAMRRFMGSDHVSFHDRGIPTVGVCEEFVGGDTSPYYHTAEDTYDKVDFAFLTLATTVAIDAVSREITAP